ncbi:MAG TPA: rhamnulokinase [Verrucomicrobia bacterium]|nr:rhamnulokinase [Verrucomicrobiota bacterium]
MVAKKLLAVDMGASGGKCFVGSFGDHGFSMQEIHRFAHEGTTFFAQDRHGVMTDRTVWDDTYIYRQILDGLHTYRRDVGDHLDAIGIDTWGADGMLVTANGDIPGKVYCYRDHRLDGMIDEVKARIDAARLYQITGIHFQPFNLSNQLLWLVQHRPELLALADTYLPISSLFNFYLAGVKKVDSSGASVTQLMDAHTREWSDEVLDALGIPMRIMPGIVDPGTTIGSVSKPLADMLRLNQASLIAVASHDTASAYAAAPIANPAEALIISAGTWCLVGKLVPEPLTGSEALNANLSNEGGIGNTRLLKNCMGGWLVQELRRGWRIADGKEMGWAEMDSMTHQAPAFTALIDPDAPVFYNPENMEAAIVGFCKSTGQPIPAGRGGFMRLVYESLALKYRLVNEQICKTSGTKTNVVHIVGGGSKNVMLNQFTADALGVPVVAGPEEATAVGNLMVQAVGLGLIRTMQDALPIIRQAFPIRDYKPQATGAWDNAYSRFKGLCGQK